MRYRTIGTDPKTRREVSVLSLGGMLFGTAISEPTLVGASSVAQLDESLAAVDLELTAQQRARLDAAG